MRRAISLDLPSYLGIEQNKLLGIGPGTDYVDGILGDSTVKGAPQGFAVDGDDLAIAGLTKVVCPVDKALGEFSGLAAVS